MCSSNVEFFYDSPIHSELESKLKHLLLKLAADNKIIGIQVCAYKDGKVIIDTAAGVLGKDDPRPVQHDSLFPSLSTTKGIVAGLVHWLVDIGKLKLDDYVAKIWPGFEVNGKQSIKVHHVLNHTSGLYNAMSDTFENPSSLKDWKGCLDRTANSIPESAPGQEQVYHYSSFGWLCGGIIEHASGMKFQDVLHEAIVSPLNIEGELYIGIPPGVESRVASLTPDIEALESWLVMAESTNVKGTKMPSTFQPSKIKLATYADLFSTLEVRQAIVPAANGHFSARALARYYATLVTGGTVPPPHLQDSTCKKDDGVNRIFHNPMIHDALMGIGEYGYLALPNHDFGLGFRRCKTKGVLTGFGHGGLGGSIGFCDINHQFAMAVTVNKMSLGYVTALVVHLVCSELDMPLPDDYAMFVENKAHIKLN